MTYAQSESSVAELIRDISNQSSMYATLHDFSQRLTKMHNDLVNMEGQYRIVPGEADRITAEYCESFLHAMLKTLDAKRRADDQGIDLVEQRRLADMILANPPVEELEKQRESTE